MKKGFILWLLLIAVSCSPINLRPPTDSVPTGPVGSIDHLAMLNRLARASKDRTHGKGVLAEIEATGDTRFMAGLLDLMIYDRRLSGEMSVALNRMTGKEEFGLDWQDWLEWLGQHPEIESFAEYDVWKSDILANAIDTDFRRFVYPGIKHAPDARLEEIVWGGVRADGIIPLDDPAMIAGEGADFLWPEEWVFGLSLNGEARAYPARFLDWHEMVNDVVRGVPISLAYCTLCGSAILYKTGLAEYPDLTKADLTKTDLGGGQGDYPPTPGRLTFGSSGLLYQSNKLMYDRATDTLWFQLLGKPAFGKLVGSGVELEQLPVTLTTWEDWLGRNPHTLVMATPTDLPINYAPGSAYSDYFHSEYTMFPVAQRSRVLPTKSWVFTQFIDGHAKAYPLTTLQAEPVINDTLAGQNLVVLLDDGGIGARAYASGSHHFRAARPGPNPTLINEGLIDEAGGRWQITETALISQAGQQLLRLPGHMAFWFGWFSFHPHTEIFGLQNR